MLLSKPINVFALVFLTLIYHSFLVVWLITRYCKKYKINPEEIEKRWRNVPKAIRVSIELFSLTIGESSSNIFINKKGQFRRLILMIVTYAGVLGVIVQNIAWQEVGEVAFILFILIFITMLLSPFIVMIFVYSTIRGAKKSK